jgi:TldD protein
MRDVADALLNMIEAYRPQYADVRVVHLLSESLTVQDGAPERVTGGESWGYGVRVLLRGCWGFAASNEWSTDTMRQTVGRAVMNAEAAALAGGRVEPFDPPPPVVAEFATPVRKDPFRVPLARRLELLTGCTAAMRASDKRISVAEGTMDLRREQKFFASVTGSRISQRIVETGAGLCATAAAGGEAQTRSYPASFRGNFACAGYEFVEELDLVRHAPRVAAEAVELLMAPPCPAGEFTVILEGNQMALQIHESIGHALELDRILGYEASFAGKSFVTVPAIGRMRYGSELVSVVSDPTAPRGLGTYGYDDEGVAARRSDLIRNGELVGALACCSTAPVAGLEPSAAMRADGWRHFPMIRMTNINLEPGEWTLEGLIADTAHGLLLETNRSWSIDDRRVQFQFATEMCREIRKGKIGRVYKNACYSGITTAFWGACDAVCGARDWIMWGIPNCGKGEPMQVAHVGHGCAPARFRKVRVWGAGS